MECVWHSCRSEPLKQLELQRIEVTFFFVKGQAIQKLGTDWAKTRGDRSRTLVCAAKQLSIPWRFLGSVEEVSRSLGCSRNKRDEAMQRTKGLPTSSSTRHRSQHVALQIGQVTRTATALDGVPAGWRVLFVALPVWVWLPCGEPGHTESPDAF